VRKSEHKMLRPACQNKEVRMAFLAKEHRNFKMCSLKRRSQSKKDSKKLKRILTSGIRVFAGVCWFSNSSSTAGAVK
jgi:hypothetical protein